MNAITVTLFTWGFCNGVDQWRIQKNFVGGDNKNFKHKTSKFRMSSLKLRLIFRPKSDIQKFFCRKSGGLQKKKVFADFETDFSEIQAFFFFSKWRLIFRPKSLVLGW